MEVRFTGDRVHHLRPETALGLYLALKTERAFECQLAATIQEKIGWWRECDCIFRLFCRSGWGDCDQRQHNCRKRGTQQRSRTAAQKMSNHRVTPTKNDVVLAGVPAALIPWVNRVYPASRPILRR